MARAPQAIYSLYNLIEKGMPRATMSGIVGDAAHSFGYHLARNQLPGSDYSVTLAKDKLGKSDCASALDVSLPPDLMKSVTARLVKQAKAKDPRLKALREFCGTLNGSQTYPWDLSSNSSEGINSWDDSHLWHVHLSFYREYADNAAALAPIAQVFTGVTPTTDWLTMTTKAEVQAMITASQKTTSAQIAALRKLIVDDILTGHDGQIHHVEAVAAVGAQNITYAQAQAQWAGHTDTSKANK